MLFKRPALVPVIGTIAVIVSATCIGTSSPAAADPQSALASAVDAARSGSGCPPLRTDPLVARVAEMASKETSDYINFRTPVVPFTDPMPALKTIGYTGSKADLLSGYGHNETDAIHGLILEGHAMFHDCAYTQYGINALQENDYVLTSLVLAHP